MTAVVTPWHKGEVAVHDLLKVPTKNNPTATGFPLRYEERLLQSSIVAVGTLDDQGRPWTTIWGGERGFAQRTAEDVISFNSVVDMSTDPVFEALWSDQPREGTIKGRGRPMSGLTVDLETRDRIKIVASRMIAGAVVDGKVQMTMHVTGSLGNCPKYISKKEISSASVEKARCTSRGLPLSAEALEHLDQADMFFHSTTNGESMDTNIRGGLPGFVRVMKNEAAQVVLIYLEYSGNRLYQSLGNLYVNPLMGIVVPNYDTGDALYLTGTTSILIGDQASSIIARTNLAIKIDVTDARFVKAGLPFRGRFIDYSPYSPPVRHLVSEQSLDVAPSSSNLTATLVNREYLSPNIARFTFDLSSPRSVWTPGQHITFDVYDHLYAGYKHMNNDNPQSLNDDFVRTFTVSNVHTGDGKVTITAKKHGPATTLLWQHPLDEMLKIAVMGFGGKESFHMVKGRESVFVAGGVGITPMLAQAASIMEGDNRKTVKVLWSLRAEDLSLAEDSFRNIHVLAAATKVFVTGRFSTSSSDQEDDVVERLRELGAEVQIRRMVEGDFASLKGNGTKFYLCAAPQLLGNLTQCSEFILNRTSLSSTIVVVDSVYPTLNMAEIPTDELHYFKTSPLLIQKDRVNYRLALTGAFAPEN
ncbi:hypothetical protein FSARC_8640 [Fusarium sarcochroum]|uniref:FAD-binding FR-type domain-containing protein n=1 Tax=Fusarium sarcochroum TaxID=1208366 RepID=A0A8H4TSW1_9HYPO|nr:hypothetical protein FSARC_8640 [Fusarium sarcochroum]